MAFIAVLQRLLGGRAGRGHQRVRVIERDQVEHQIADRGLRGAEHALDAAGALLQLDPDDAGALEGLEGLGELRAPEAVEAEHRREPTAELQEVAAGDAAGD